MQDETFNDEVTNFIMVIGLLTRRVRASVASNDLSWTQTMVIGRLAKEGPTTASDLARAEGVKPQSMGTIIGELMELGLVERRPHPTDGRQMMIELTEKGLSVRQRAKEEKRTWLSQAIAQLSEPDQKTLFEAGRIIHRLVEP